MPEHPSKPPDELVRQIRSKDGATYLDMVARYGRYFRWYFICHNIPPPEAEDLAIHLIQDIVLEKIDKFVGDDGDFRKWVIVLMKHECTDWHRRTRLRFEPLREDLCSGKKPDGEWRAAEASETDALADMLSKLPQGDREILEQRYLNGYDSSAELAMALGEKPGAVRVRIHRALHRLRTLVGEGATERENQS